MLKFFTKIKDRAKGVGRAVTVTTLGGVGLAYLNWHAHKARENGNELLLDVKITMAIRVFHDLMTDYIEQRIQGAPSDIGEYLIMREDFRQRMTEIFIRDDMGMVEEFCKDHDIQSGRDQSEVN